MQNHTEQNPPSLYVWSARFKMPAFPAATITIGLGSVGMPEVLPRPLFQMQMGGR